MSTVIKGTRIVAVNQFSNFDASRPDKAGFDAFTLASAGKDGMLDDFWVKEGYTQVGTAAIEITLMARDKITSGAVATLRRQQKKVLADAQAENTRIEQQIQSLLAITM